MNLTIKTEPWRKTNLSLERLIRGDRYREKALRSHQVFIVEFENGILQVLSNTNALGGQCDCCINHSIRECRVKRWTRATIRKAG